MSTETKAALDAALAAHPNSYSSAHMATIEEWDGAERIAAYGRNIVHRHMWEKVPW